LKKIFIFFTSVSIFIYFCLQAFDEAANTKDKPTAILAKTFKGKEFPDIEDLENWHGKPLGKAAPTVLEVNIIYLFLWIFPIIKLSCMIIIF
jgi:hypothetical protein